MIRKWGKGVEWLAESMTEAENDQELPSCFKGMVTYETYLGKEIPTRLGLTEELWKELSTIYGR